MRNLSWLQQHLGLEIPTSSPILAGFTSAKAGHITEQKKPISLSLWGKIQKATSSVVSESPLGIIACLVIRIILLGVRYGHARQATLESWDGRKQVWVFQKGKMGASLRSHYPHTLGPSIHT